ncbi:hypothetical protein KCV06_g13, partial [Aureobasidium melanogenum]
MQVIVLLWKQVTASGRCILDGSLVYEVGISVEEHNGLTEEKLQVPRTSNFKTFILPCGGHNWQLGILQQMASEVGERGQAMAGPETGGRFTFEVAWILERPLTWT